VVSSALFPLYSCPCSLLAVVFLLGLADLTSFQKGNERLKEGRDRDAVVIYSACDQGVMSLLLTEWIESDAVWWWLGLSR
jgi:hypothetical protein